MRRLQNKMLLVMIMGILISSLVSGMLFTYATRNTINYDSQQILDLKAIHASSELSKKILMCENNNELMAGFITKTITTISNVTDYHYSATDIDNWNGLAWSMVEDTQDISAIGFHFNPSFIHRKNAGFLISYSNTTGRMENLSSDYEDSLKPRTEDGFLSPYAQAVLAKKTIWTVPYYNKINGIYSITNAKPIYIKHQLVGVVFCELDFDRIANNTNSISLYEHGKALLTDRYGQQLNYGGAMVNVPNSFMKKVAKQGNYQALIKLNGAMTYLYARRVTDNMYMIVTVPQTDVLAARNRTIFTVLFSIISLSAVLCLIAVTMVNKLFRMACKDSLTDASNKISYQEYLKELEKRIAYTHRSYGVAVFDINHLKAVNDEQGHMAGDQLIRDGYEVIHLCFPEDEVFRIGGDEFVVVFDDPDLKKTRNRVERFKRIMDKRARDFSSSSQVVVSCGYSEWQRDEQYRDVFKRADHDMYKEKAKFYAYNPQVDRRR